MTINSIFCLSLPGAHMTYMAVLVKCLLQKLVASDEYLLKNGSWHGINNQLPVEFLSYKFSSPRSIELWNEYYNLNVTTNLTVFRDDWRDSITSIIEEGINSTRSLVILNTSNTRLEKYYRFLNAIDRIPLYLFRNMRNASNYYPNLWSILPKHVKRTEFEKNINFNIATRIPNFTVPTLQTSLIDLLELDYYVKVQKFLDQHKLLTLLDNNIIQMHQTFIKVNKINIIRAKRLLEKDFWSPRHLLDEILFTGIIKYGF